MKFSYIRLLGHGEYGEVWHIRDSLTQKDFALKQRIREADEGIAEDVLREIQVMERVSHFYILPLLDMWFEKGAFRKSTCRQKDIKESSITIRSSLLLPLAKETLKQDLEKRCVNYFVFFSVQEHVKMVKERGFMILQALQALHKEGLIHGDLKPSNILLQKEKNDLWLADFGLSRMVRNEISQDMIYTVDHRAPEILWQKHTIPIFSASDMYAFGILLLEMMFPSLFLFPKWDDRSVRLCLIKWFGTPSKSWTDTYCHDDFKSLIESSPKDNKQSVPFLNLENMFVFITTQAKNCVLYRTILKNLQKEDLNHFKNMVSQCLCFDPKVRITATNALQHDFFSNVSITFPSCLSSFSSGEKTYIPMHIAEKIVFFINLNFTSSKSKKSNSPKRIAFLYAICLFLETYQRIDIKLPFTLKDIFLTCLFLAWKMTFSTAKSALTVFGKNVKWYDMETLVLVPGALGSSLILLEQNVKNAASSEKLISFVMSHCKTCSSDEEADEETD